MIRLLIVTAIWAFSFSLIGKFVAGKIDTYLAVFIRLLLAFIVFIPFLNFKIILKRESFLTMSIGALQIGIMYLFYFNSFKFLTVSEVALFTITTPLYVSLIGSLLESNFKIIQLVSVTFVIAGALLLKWSNISSDFIMGFFLIQGANISFGLGQVLYRKYIPEQRQAQKFGLFYLGSMIPVLVVLLFRPRVNLHEISYFQWGVLIWLGCIASGLCYYLWNTGSKLVSYGELAVMNNAVIPLAIAFNVFFWGSQINWGTFLVGSSIILIGVVFESRRSGLALSR